MKKFKVWLTIEELDEEVDFYEDVPDEIRNVGPEFDTLLEAAELRDNLIDTANKGIN